MGILKHNEKKARIKELRVIIERYKTNREEFISSSRSLYNKRKSNLLTILKIKKQLNTIKNLPKWCNQDFATAISLLDDFYEATLYETEPIVFVDKKDKSGRTRMMIENAIESSKGDDDDLWNSSLAVAIATVIGTATIGATIDVMAGESATTSALSWLSSDDSYLNSIKKSFLLSNPIIALVIAATGSALIRTSNQKQIREIDKQIVTVQNELDKLTDRLKSLKTLINRTNNYEKKYLLPSVDWLKNVSPKDYKEWNEDQKLKLEQTINHISNMANLINERI